MLTLHYAPDNASLIVRLALEAAAVPYTTRLVDRRARAQCGAAYRRLNPAGRIPTLETPDGPVFETGAILLWLAERHPGLGPAALAPERGAWLSWLFFVSNTLHADMRALFCPADHAPAGAAQAHHTLTARRLVRHLALIDAHAPIAPQCPGALDFYLACCLRWCALYPRGGIGWFDRAATPALARLARALDGHPAALAAARAEGLGPTPFSAPSLADPPEGSAT